jgi:hypothetical protein
MSIHARSLAVFGSSGAAAMDKERIEPRDADRWDGRGDGEVEGGLRRGEDKGERDDEKAGREDGRPGERIEDGDGEWGWSQGEKIDAERDNGEGEKR